MANLEKREKRGRKALIEKMTYAESSRNGCNQFEILRICPDKKTNLRSSRNSQRDGKVALHKEGVMGASPEEKKD